MIVKAATYFKNDIYLPHAKVSVTDSVKGVESKIDDYIDEYEQDCLFKCFGSRLYTEFIATLDSSVPTFIKAGSDAKWGYLLNGLSYTNPNGDAVIWKGIRQKTISLGVTEDADSYDKSFLADYIYFHYESNSYITRANAGSVKSKSANAVTVAPTQKVVKAWRKFVRLVQGSLNNNPYFYKESVVGLGGLGVDYYQGNGTEVSLYQFIADQNDLVEDTYADFEPKLWGDINQFGM